MNFKYIGIQYDLEMNGIYFVGDDNCIRIDLVVNKGHNFDRS